MSTSEDITHSDYQVLEEMKRKKTMVYDPRISLNTIVICLSVLGGGLTVLDRITAAAASQAVFMKEIEQLKATDIELRAQRVIDRGEIIGEIKEIGRKVDNLAQRK